MSRAQRSYPPNTPGSSGATSSISRGGSCPGNLPDIASPRGAHTQGQRARVPRSPRGSGRAGADARDGARGAAAIRCSPHHERHVRQDPTGHSQPIRLKAQLGALPTCLLTEPLETLPQLRELNDRKADAATLSEMS